MTVSDKIRASHYWQSGEPFTIQDMRLAIGCKASAVAAALRYMDDEVTKTTEWLQNGSRTSYRARTLTRDWLKKPLVSPWAMELGRGRLPR